MRALTADASRSEADAALLPGDVQRAPAAGSVVADLIRLTKPRITTLVIVTGLGGMWLATRLGAAPRLDWLAASAALLSIALVVGSANALNMVLERDVDGLMERTRNRPLPTGRLSTGLATAFGLGLAAVSLPLLAWLVNGITAWLAAASLVLYVLAYTPLKRVTPAALLVGAIPGAAPPLLGWTAATGSVGAAGVALFAVLFFWQLPHFLAIATFRKDDYVRAGIRVMPAVRGERATRVHATLHAVALLASSLALVWLGVRSPIYVIAALVLGVGMLWTCLRGLTARSMEPEASIKWARSVFLTSLIYLPAFFAALMLGA